MEVRYLFDKVNVDVIVFEDIDRYDFSSIFERLHEINTLVNNERKGNPLRFFYLLRDDIFISKDRTKFFDFIIPIVPVIDGSNSFDKFIECFQKSGIIVKSGETAGGINSEFLQGLSLYVDDMRILQNICNEFAIYQSHMSSTEQNSNKMLALITYKNLFPRDFAELQLGHGFMFEIIGGNGKKRIILIKVERLNAKIKQIQIELNTLKTETLTEDELSYIYARKIHTTRAVNWNVEDCRSQVLALKHNNSYKSIVEEYEKRFVCAINNKDMRISQLENETFKLNEELMILKEKRLHEIVSRKNIDSFFNEAVFKSETGHKDEFFEAIKDSPYFAMLKYFIQEGYIDETYSDYMTYFYQNSLSRIDKVFLRSVTDRKAKESSYRLDKPEMVVSRLPLAYLKQEETLNYDLFEFLLLDYVGQQRYLEKTRKLISQIRENNLYSYLVDYLKNKRIADNFVKTIGLEWNSFISDFFKYFKMKNGYTDATPLNNVFVKNIAFALFRLIGENKNNVSFIDKDSSVILVEYVSSDCNFLNTDIIEIQEVADGFKQLGVSFIEINSLTANRELLKLIYSNSSYVINYDNISTMLQEYYTAVGLEEVPTRGYTIIMSDKESHLAKYINANIDTYMDVLLENCGGKITDSQEFAKSIINNKDIEKENRTAYINFLCETVIVRLTDINDTELWIELLKNGNILEYSPLNVISYFLERCTEFFDETLIKFINSKESVFTFGDIFENDDDKGMFFSATVNAITLNNFIYEGYIKQFNRIYNKFGVDGLPIDKLSILDKCGKIGMTAESLNFIRENYTEYLYSFILNHIEDYIEVVSDESVFVFEESCELLDEQISDAYKIDLLKLTTNTLSVQDKDYSDELYTYILQQNYDDGDFEYLMKNYDKFGKNSQAVILSILVSQLSRLQTMINKVPRLLIEDILSSSKIELEGKRDVFKSAASKATNDEIKQWLVLVELKDFLRIYEENLRPKFENTEINSEMLAIFKERRLIANYELEENGGRYKIIRNKLLFSQKTD